MRNILTIAATVCAGALLMRMAAATADAEQAHGTGRREVTFKTAATCTACHTGLTTPSGEDVSIAADWRGSMMANSSRDPYWLAAVRRETIDHPRAAAEIEDECAVCHMPMSRAQSTALGRRGQVFAHLPARVKQAPLDALAHDGVSCTVCHQISAKNLGSPESFTGGFVLEPADSNEEPRLFGPFAIDNGRTTIMRSASGFRPTEATHIGQSEMCATCHTLYTHARGANGEVIARFPEQVPYLEWQNSAFPSEQQTCQSCHMPVVAEHTPIASVLGEPRAGVSRHTFRGGNSFMLRILDRYRGELGVAASTGDLERAIRANTSFLQHDTASLSVDRLERSGDRLNVDLTVVNRSGHKLPTGYPARRVWIDLTVKDGRGETIFRSGEVTAQGLIAGNDNDADPLRYEPHHNEIREAQQVQVYESVMADASGAPTTGLIKGVRYLKDNRLLPRGFDRSKAHPDARAIGVNDDPTFEGGGDRIRYSVRIGDGSGPFAVEAVLRFQPIGFRWAENLDAYKSPETQRFVAYYNAMSASGTEILARASAATR